MQPFASQGWLELAKLEEEAGHAERCKLILDQGLWHCTHNEALVPSPHPASPYLAPPSPHLPATQS